MISLSAIAIRQGAFSLQNIALEVPTGAYGVLMGKTGSGKTTLLEAICGLRPVAAGTVRLMGRDVTRLKPAARSIGYVPQDMALFSTLTRARTPGLRPGRAALEPSGHPGPRGRTGRAAGDRALAGPQARGLSGGEAQRVALGRGLAMRPDVLLVRRTAQRLGRRHPPRDVRVAPLRSASRCR